MYRKFIELIIAFIGCFLAVSMYIADAIAKDNYYLGTVGEIIFYIGLISFLIDVIITLKTKKVNK